MARFLLTQHTLVIRHLSKEIRGAAERALLSAAARTVQHIVTTVIPQTHPQPVDRGAFKAGWTFKQVAGGALVYNRMPYASIIEYGARAANIKIGRKMIEAISAWARRKGIVSNDIDGHQVAWAIAKTFQKTGIFDGGKGLRVLEKASKRIPDFIREEFKRELGRGDL